MTGNDKLYAGLYGGFERKPDQWLECSQCEERLPPQEYVGQHYVHMCKPITLADIRRIIREEVESALRSHEAQTQPDADIHNRAAKR
jgi:hypothetical protein